MSGAREAILGRIRHSLGVGDVDAGRRSIVISRLETTPRGVVPARGQLPAGERIGLFVAMAEKVSASVERLATMDSVPEKIAEYLRDNNLPPAIRMGEDPILAALPFDREPRIAITRGPSDGGDIVGLSRAVAGVAETGTLVFVSGPDNPTTLNFLPDAHIALLAVEDIVGDYETVWDALRQRYGKGGMPRTVNFVTGPSRSADIEQTLLLGAHGPRQLHILLVG